MLKERESESLSVAGLVEMGGVVFGGEDAGTRLLKEVYIEVNQTQYVHR